jgi:hypothetical protein
MIEKALELNLGVPRTGNDDSPVRIEGAQDALIEFGVLRRIAARFPTAGAVVQTLQGSVRVHVDLGFTLAAETKHLCAAMIYPDDGMMETVHEMDLPRRQRPIVD